MQTSAPSTADSALQRIRRRLERLELEHLRRHAAEQAARIEQLEAKLATAEDEAIDAWRCAEEWREATMTNLHQVMEMGAHVGITREGDVLISPPDGIDLHAAAHIVMEQAQ